MSQEELVGAYVDGQISRRALIQKLIAGGLTVGAATAYAQLLAPKAGASARRGVEPPPKGEYPECTVKVRSKDLGQVKREKIIKVRLRSMGDPDDRASLRVVATVEGQRIARTTISSLESIGTFDLELPVKNANPLRKENSVDVSVTVTHKNKTNGDVFLLAEDTGTLTKGG